MATATTVETFKKRDSWPLVLVQGRLSLGVRPWDIAHTRACGHGVLVGRFRERLNYGPSLRWGKDRAESAAFDASRRPRSDPSVCTTQQPHVEARGPCECTPASSTTSPRRRCRKNARSDLSDAAGMSRLSCTRARQVSGPCALHRHGEWRHMCPATSGPLSRRLGRRNIATWLDHADTRHSEAQIKNLVENIAPGFGGRVPFTYPRPWGESGCDLM